MKRIIILTLAYSSDKELIGLSTIGLQAAANTFQHSLLRGIKKEFQGEVLVINCLPVGTWPKQYKKAILKDVEYSIENCKCIDIGSVNIPIIKQAQRSLKIRRKLSEIISSGDQVLIYSTYLPFLWAAGHTKNCKSTIIVTDLPEYYDLQRVSILRMMLRKALNVLIYKYLSRINSFVLLTDGMKKPLKLNGRPYVVVEGICDSIPSDSQNVTYDAEKEVLFYSGSLAYSSGILDLIAAVVQIKSKPIELWICGKGEASKKIEEICKTETAIRFFGFCTKDEVADLRSKATILVNPRKNDGIFTKYSFPSKTMEYMASGKPVVMYKLSGIPNEYWNYLYCVEEAVDNALKAKIEEVISIPRSDRMSLAEKAKQFVISQKNEYVQARKIIEIMESS